MKNIITCLLAALGLTTACGQQRFEDTDVSGFAQLISNTDAILLDVRTSDEFKDGHLEGAINIDQAQNDFLEKVSSTLPVEKTIAVYCRSGRRSANAANKLADKGYKVVNLKGGILAWKEASMPVTTASYEVDTFKTKNGKIVRFHALMHASIRIQYDGKEIEIDPVQKLGNRQIDYTNLPKADYILVTHEHQDHYSPDAIKQLTQKGTQFITNQRCADMLGYGEVMNNGDSKVLANDITLKAVPAYNITEGHMQFHPKGRDNGFILTLDGLHIYIAGDTEDIPDMAALKDIDIAFLPCNQPYTMTTDQLLHAAQMVKPKVLFPYHYGKTDVSALPSQLRSEGIDVRIRHYE